MATDIEVRVHRSGVVCGDDIRQDGSVEAVCGHCGKQAEAVAVIAGGPPVCAGCIRAHLDAMSVARWRLRQSTAGLPWGKVTS